MGRLVNSWQDLCACGMPKNRYAKECHACHLAHRRDTCRCGKPKYKTKPLCRDCTHTRDFCACGNTKDKRAQVCTICRQQEPPDKRCLGCGEVFPIETYRLRPDGHGGYKRRSRCPECEKKEQNVRHARNPEHYKALKQRTRQKEKERRQNDPAFDHQYKVKQWKRFWVKQGYDADMLLAYMEEQGWRCEICNTPLDFSSKAIDHDHSTGKFRGMLCSHCNMGLGLFKDNITFLQQAIAYLQNTPRTGGVKEPDHDRTVQ